MNPSAQPFQLWPSWYCIKDTSKVGGEHPLQHEEMYKISEKWPYQQKQKAKGIHSSFLFLEWHTANFGKWPQRPDVRLEPSLPKIHVYWKVIQLFLNCCISGVIPKPAQLPPTCRDTTATPLPSPGKEEKMPSPQGAVGTALLSFLVWDFGFFVKVVWLILTFFKNYNYY